MSKRKWDDEGNDSPGGYDQAAKIAAQLAQQYGGGSPSLPPPKPVVETVDPAFTKDVEINDLRNRYVLTRASTQQKILDDTGATVVTRGQWYPDKALATDRDPPLYLHITAETQEALNRGVRATQDLIDQELGPLTEKPKPRERNRWPEEKLIIGLESLRNFNVRAKIVGPAGLFVKYIQQETQTRVQIKGIGSGFVDPETGRESDEPMHVFVCGPDEQMVNRAKELADDLLIVVREEWAKTKAVNEGYTLPSSGGAGYPAAAGFGQQQQYPGYSMGGQPPLPGSMAPPPPPGSAPPPPPGGALDDDWQPPASVNSTPEQKAYWAQILANPQYKAYYKAYYEQQGQQQAPSGYGAQTQGYGYPQQPSGPAPPSAPAPPMPPSEPPRREGRGMYGAVPPPPM